ncbi:MAG: helix-turn-helix domain-containing protein [Bacteroidota bacterium]
MPAAPPTALSSAEASCPVTAVVDLVGGKWKIPILWQLGQGTLRFGELRRALPGVSEKMLAQQLGQLTGAGLVARTAFAEVPPRVEYALTPLGRSLAPALDALATWGATHLDGVWRSPGV